VPHGIRHGQHGEAEGQGDAQEADAELDALPGDDVGGEELRREDGAATAAEDEPEGAERLGAQT
jgi:hypothetical protein